MAFGRPLHSKTIGLSEQGGVAARAFVEPEDRRTRRPMAKMLPAIFFGHGNPMNAITRNGYTEAWRRLGQELPRPKTILAISAHWFVPQTGVTISAAPRTIHDFGGFPPELYQVEYPAPGDPVLARRVQRLLAPLDVTLDDSWGLDHGTWSVLKHVYPKADIPVVQLSIDETKPASYHFEIGRKLAPLREEGVLIAGSGNLVHNLHAYAWGRHASAPYDWAARFESVAREIMLSGASEPLVEYESLGPDAALSIPTPEHYLPLLYVLGSRQEGEGVCFPVEGIDGGSISMLSAQIG
jgi:4,5-DOPA dioxygenase extradiol